MKTSLSQGSLSEITEALRSSLDAFAKQFPGSTGERQPVHTVYGGAHLFRSDTTKKLGTLAVRALETYAPDANVFARALGIADQFAETVYERVIEKLRREAVEDFRIDFEDGYGSRPDDEEDRHAESAAVELAKGFANKTLSPFIGIRIKPLTEELHVRALRTLDIFLTTLISETGGALPENFVVMLPKVIVPEQPAALSRALDKLEEQLGLAASLVKMEMMIETPTSIIAPTGEAAPRRLVEAAQGRCIAVHFGAYDYTASLDITAAHQDMLHPACDFARHVMQVSLSGTGVWLADGATNIMPIPAHRGEDLTVEQKNENELIVWRAWRLHFDHVRNSLSNGFHQSWDLHPAQLPSRYAAVYSFFLESLEPASERLKNFIDQAARATLVGDVFDDAATGQGLLNYFLRAINCGAITQEEAQQRTSLAIDELQSGSFAKILKNRQE